MSLVGHVDALLDHQIELSFDLDAERAKTEILRDALADCLMELPDSAKWFPHQELYVLTDPEMLDYLATA